MENNEETGRVLVYDLKSLPDGKTLRKIINVIKREGVVYWDSSNGGEKPIITKIDEGDRNSYLKDAKIIDINII